MVEKQDMDSCSVLGGQQMILTGQNFSSDSKVIFLEKTQGEWQQMASSLASHATCREKQYSVFKQCFDRL